MSQKLEIMDHTSRWASGGHDYEDLKREIPDWSYQLHTYGHVLDNNTLETIAIEGLVRWYINKNIPFSIDFNPNIIMENIDNPNYLSFYEIKNIILIGNYFGIHHDKINYLDITKYNTKYMYFIKHVKNKKEHSKYSVKQFGFYVCNKIGFEDFIIYLKSIYNEISQKYYFFENGSFFNTFLIKYKKIKPWGIIFQKFKVIVEKLIRYKHKDIYIVDKFVEKSQQYIFTLVTKYCENFMICDENEIIIENEYILNSEELLKKYSDVCNVRWELLFKRLGIDIN